MSCCLSSAKFYHASTLTVTIHCSMSNIAISSRILTELTEWCNANKISHDTGDSKSSQISDKGSALSDIIH